jgi:hypothetical protein
MKRHASDDFLAAHIAASQSLARIVRAETIAAEVLEA